MMSALAQIDKRYSINYVSLTCAVHDRNMKLVIHADGILSKDQRLWSVMSVYFQFLS